MKNPQEEANKLRDEAKKILHSKFKIPDNCIDHGLERLVDCIIGAAILEIAALHQTASQQQDNA